MRVFGKVKVINHFLKKLQLANSLKKISRMFVGAKFDLECSIEKSKENFND